MKTIFNRILIPAMCVLVFAATSLAQGTSTFFVKIDNVPGEVTDPRYLDYINVFSFKLGVNQTDVSYAGGGAKASKANVHPLTIYKFVDKASPLLFIRCAKGQSIRRVELIGIRDETFEFLKIKLSDAVILSVDQELSLQGAGNILIESVTLTFRRIELIYTPQKPDGSADAPITVGWDLLQNNSF